MKQGIKKWTVILLAFAAGALLVWLVSPGENSTGEKSSHQHESEEGEVWTCSMHPNVRKSEPGDCPICGMDLIKVDEQAAGLDPDAVEMTQTAMKLANVQTVEVGMGENARSLRLTGKIEADERLSQSQSSHIPGRVEELLVNFSGELVSKGQTIARVYSPELATAQRELLEAAKYKSSEPELFESAKSKLRNWKLTEKQIEEIVSSGKVKEVFPIDADVSGVVMEKSVNEGDYVKAGERIYEIANLSRVWLMLDVYESNLNWIEEGSTVEFSVPSIPDKIFEGRVSFIDPVINGKSRVAKARVVVQNDGELKPGMFVNAGLTAGEKENQVLSVPKSAVLWTGKRSVVYVKSATDAGTFFNMREVTLGKDLGDSYEIVSGLKSGEEIAASGAFSIDAAAQLNGKPSMMSVKGDDQSKKAMLSNSDKEKFSKLIDDYLSLKNTLVNDNLSGSKDSREKLSESLSSLNLNGLDEKAADHWKSLKSQMERSVGEMEKADALSEMRKHFQSLSNAMIQAVKMFGTGGDKLFIQHCPMADNNNGADWLSSEDEVLNPYFGESMLKCGEVTGEVE
ncbi:efflux RND transporter periplasmic adaptor subunit [Halocola ammonii]